MNRLIEFNSAMEKSKAKEINLKEVFAVIKKRYLVVLAIVVIFGLLGFIYGQLSTNPLYQTSSRIIIKAGAEDRTTLQVIMKDSTIMEKVVERLKIRSFSRSVSWTNHGSKY